MLALLAQSISGMGNPEEVVPVSSVKHELTFSKDVIQPEGLGVFYLFSPDRSYAMLEWDVKRIHEDNFRQVYCESYYSQNMSGEYLSKLSFFSKKVRQTGMGFHLWINPRLFLKDHIKSGDGYSWLLIGHSEFRGTSGEVEVVLKFTTAQIDHLSWLRFAPDRLVRAWWADDAWFASKIVDLPVDSGSGASEVGSFRVVSVRDDGHFWIVKVRGKASAGPGHYFVALKVLSSAPDYSKKSLAFTRKIMLTLKNSGVQPTGVAIDEIGPMPPLSISDDEFLPKNGGMRYFPYLEDYDRAYKERYGVSIVDDLPYLTLHIEPDNPDFKRAFRVLFLNQLVAERMKNAKEIMYRFAQEVWGRSLARGVHDCNIEDPWVRDVWRNSRNWWVLAEPSSGGYADQWGNLYDMNEVTLDMARTFSLINGYRRSFYMFADMGSPTTTSDAKLIDVYYKGASHGHSLILCTWNPGGGPKWHIPDRPSVEEFLRKHGSIFNESPRRIHRSKIAVIAPLWTWIYWYKAWNPTGDWSYPGYFWMSMFGKIGVEADIINPQIMDMDSYEYIFVPDSMVLPQDVVEKIMRYYESRVKSGKGKLVFLGALPQYDTEGNDISKTFSDIVGISNRVSFFPPHRGKYFNTYNQQGVKVIKFAGSLKSMGFLKKNFVPYGWHNNDVAFLEPKADAEPVAFFDANGDGRLEVVGVRNGGVFYFSFNANGNFPDAVFAYRFLKSTGFKEFPVKGKPEDFWDQKDPYYAGTGRIGYAEDESGSVVVNIDSRDHSVVLTGSGEVLKVPPHSIVLLSRNESAKKLTKRIVSTPKWVFDERIPENSYGSFVGEGSFEGGKR